jgi:hypothetical protein
VPDEALHRLRGAAVKIKLENAIVGTKTIKVELRPALYALQCDGCGKIFKMSEYCNDMGLAKLECLFDAAHNLPRDLGNSFEATVCSFQCAHEVFANGGWKKMPEYNEQAALDCRLVRATLLITSFVRDEAELRQEWASRYPEETK